jgi:hypothetical protein
MGKARGRQVGYAWGMLGVKLGLKIVFDFEKWVGLKILNGSIGN